MAVLGVWSWSCRGRDPQARAEAAMLRRQIDGLRKLSERKGGLFAPDRLAVGVKAELVRQLLQRRLPLESDLFAPLHIRLETAEIVFEDGESLVTLKGRVHSGAADVGGANLLLLGSLNRFEVDTRTGILTTHVELDRVEVERLDAGRLEQGVTQSVAQVIGGRSLSALGEVLPALEIPVRLDHQIDFAGLADDTLSVPPKVLPVHVAVDRAVPIGGRLWMFLGVTTR
jgi:hypothetical protein